MKKTGLSILILLASATLQAENDRLLTRTFPVEPEQKVEVGLGAGDILIEGAEGAEAQVQMRIHCESSKRSCWEKADKVELVAKTSANHLNIEVEGLTRSTARGMSIRLRIILPRSQYLEVDLGAGDLKVDGMAGSMELDVGVGDVEVRLERGIFRSIEMDTGIGESRVIIAGEIIEGAGLVGSDLKWSHDSGQQDLEIDCGVGDIVVTTD